MDALLVHVLLRYEERWRQIGRRARAQSTWVALGAVVLVSQEEEDLQIYQRLTGPTEAHCVQMSGGTFYSCCLTTNSIQTS